MLSEWINTCIQQFYIRFFVNQCLTILALLLLGMFCIICMRKGMKDIWTLLLSYPLGLAVYVLFSFLLLLLGIPYNRVSILLSILLFCIILAVVGKPHTALLEEISGIQNKKGRLVIAGLVLLVIVFSVSGLLSISLSNDSMYYYSLYSRAIVKYGLYRREFNVFLTDIGQGAALIGTLPHFFGFNETFGIQQFFNINFLCIFVYAVYEQAAEKELIGKKKAAVFAAFAFLVMVSAMPYIIVSKWAMANVYFMEYLFICCYLALRFQMDANRAERGLLFIQGIFMAMLSILRMEGGVFVIFAVLCISTLNYKNKQLAFVFLLPSVLLQVIYDIRIFALNLSIPYAFLTPKKAAVQIIGMVLVLSYLLIIRGRFFVKIQKHMTSLILIGLLLVNAGLCVLDHEIYIGNLEAFSANLFHQSGWGLFPCFVLGVLFLLPKKGVKLNYTDLLWLGYLLVTLAVCWARDGVLREGVGDSGNRVLLQIVPLVVFALVMQALNAYTGYRREQE